MQQEPCVCPPVLCNGPLHRPRLPWLWPVLLSRHRMGISHVKLRLQSLYANSHSCFCVWRGHQRRSRPLQLSDCRIRQYSILSLAGFHRSGLSSHECLVPTSRNGTQHTRMSFQHLHTMSSLWAMCHRGVSEAVKFGPSMPDKSEPQHQLSLATFPGCPATQGLAGTFSCLPPDSRNQTHGNFKHVRFCPILNFGLLWAALIMMSVFCPTRNFRQFWADLTFSAVRSTFLAGEEAQNVEILPHPKFWPFLGRLLKDVRFYPILNFVFILGASLPSHPF